MLMAVVIPFVNTKWKLVNLAAMNICVIGKFVTIVNPIEPFNATYDEEY